MDDLTLEKELHDNYYNKKDRMQISESGRRRLENLSLQTKHTKVRNRVLLAQIISIILFLIFIPSTAYAMVTISEVLLEKVKDANLSEKQIIKLNNDLTEGHYSEEHIANANALKTNEYGQTYGPDLFGADLIAVVSEEGLHGYVYREDLYPEHNFKTPEEALEWQDNQPMIKSFTVYESDGRTAIGEFIIGSGTVHEYNE
ncbi:MAG: hypothetical protein K0R21_2122 [Anaerocolumna sp.]|jgi:hypothetical protein|nr:hypothetical protein [Anaerocolumna sp.]